MININTSLPNAIVDTLHDTGDFTRTVCETSFTAGKMFIDAQTMSVAMGHGLVVDGRAGGFVVGRLHEEGHIPLIRWEDDRYVFFAKMEGSEFIVNRLATLENFDEVESINKNNSGDVATGLNLNDKLPRIIDARSGISTKAVLIDGGEYIISRKATRNSIDRLIEINETTNPYTGVDPMKVLLGG